MFRVLFALVVAISVVNCSKGGGEEAATVAASASGAGKVLEVSGKVTVKGKQLAVGQVLQGDDVVETGDDGRVVIELSHNNAHWELGANKSQKVSESIAWKLPKSEGNSQFTIQDMSAAGRPAERTAANTESSAPAAAAAPPPTAQPAPAQGGAPGGAAPAPSMAKNASPPASPPAPPKMESSKALRADVGGGGAPGGGAKGGGLAGIGAGASAGGGTGAGAGAGAPPTGALAQDSRMRSPTMQNAETLVERSEPALKQCLAPGATVKLHVVVDATGKATTTVDDADAKTKACLIGVIGKLKFREEKASVNMTIEKSNR